MKRLTVTVRGTVQGVGFRAHAKATAERLGLVGTVGNNPDGSVTIVAEGPDAALDRLLEWVRTGPDAARVESLDERRTAASGGYEDFRILR